MKIVSWNVNSVRARHDRLLNWLDQNQPDVLCLQELKVSDDEFPFEVEEELDYYVETHGQRTYNGVALISRTPITDVVRGMGDGVDDPQSRLIAGTIEGVRVVCVYVPNGGALGSDKWEYKLAWYARLYAWLERHCDPEQPLILCGDFNVAVDDRDVSRLDLWGEGVLSHPDARQALGKVVGWGFWDTFRERVSEAGHYSWWDYRGMGFQKDNGLRIDMVYATTPMMRRLDSVFIDREERKGNGASDHVPVGAVFTD
jgi:exodeoxyribonuclease III